jgi:MFS family permease
MLFGGGIMLISPLLTVLMLRELDLAAWQYGLVLGGAGAGGLLGALVAPRLVQRWGRRRVLLVAGVARAVWMPLLVLAPTGVAGLVTILVAEVMLMACAGVFNPTFTAYRMSETPDHLMARVTAAWSVSSKTAQPVCMALGGAVAAATDVRTAIGVGAALVLGSVLFLPGRFGGHRLSA